MDAKRKAIYSDQQAYTPNGSMPPASALIKRAKTEQDEPVRTQTVSVTVNRSSDLLAPNVQLTGHQGEIFSCKFSPSGENFISSSMDRTILLWKTFGECKNYGVLKPHNNAILQVLWSQDGERICSASADKTVALSDAVSGARIKKYKEHTSIVNCVAMQHKYTGETDIIASGSDDGYVLVWDSRHKKSTNHLEYKLPITALYYNLSGDILFSGSVDNTINAWDMRKNEILYTLSGHTDTITGLEVGPKTGDYLISASDDSSIILWDIRPFCSNPTRVTNIFYGAPHTAGNSLIRPSFSKDESRIASGGTDRCVSVWDINTTNLTYKLPGHKGTVNQVDFHPNQPILLSASTDKTMFLGELDSTATMQKV
ncbi:hypothetical protein BB561_005760 [Smittium simulii]|uniref:Uncharacterized protein n=1 Tax=Smittium simulii TaxID=133385 RepID=A0A2T9Y8G5_9FUNG|nr:hypothetical protein BB561_005760 [Smittium simulii]